MPVDLTDRVIIITGASSGIGAATAIGCAEAGMDIVLNARRADRLEDVAEEIRQRGRRAEMMVGDVTEPGMSARLIEAAYQRLERLDAVFANAGYGIEKLQHELEDAELRRMFEVNFFAAFDLLRATAREWIRREQGGHMLMCSSCLSHFTMSAYAAYSSTKAAQHHFCRAMNFELVAHGICVSSVHPISTVTEFSRVSRELSGRSTDVKVDDLVPKWFLQPAERVAKAIVKCLRKPRPEVWTSLSIRLFAAALTLCPRLFDVAARRYQRSKYNR